MENKYSIDLAELRLDFLQRKLEHEELTPGRRILQEDLQVRFATLKSLGIFTLFDLNEVLRTPKKVKEFAVQSGLPGHYLTVLRREVNSHKPQPFNLQKIPNIDLEMVQRLQECGIKNTRQIIENASTPLERTQLSRKSGLSQEKIWEFVSMADLARVYGVGPVFVRILFDAGINSLETLANSEPSALYAQVIAVNKEKGYTKIMPNVNDMRVCIEFARLLPVVLEA